MPDPARKTELPPIPDKRYFKISEVSQLCRVPAHTLRLWEQEFEQLKPAKRTGNRRSYRREDIVLIRQIRSLRYEQRYTIAGVRQWLAGEVAKADQMRFEELVRKTLADLEKLLRMLRS